MSYLHTDFETRGVVELRGKTSVGLWNYVHHRRTEPLMLAWAFDDEPVEVWQMHKGAMPDKLRAGLEDPKQMLAAWNSMFERYVFEFKLGVKVPIERFSDPQASASYLSLPKDLDDVSEILGLPSSLAKDKKGKELIKIFSQPTRRTKTKKGVEGLFYFRDWDSDPDLWEEFVQYCCQDVVAEREIQKRLTAFKVFPLPAMEQKIWLFDQRVNDRGIPTDIRFVKKAYAIANIAKQKAIENMDRLTGLDNSNSRDQMLGWAKVEGYTANNLKKETVVSQLKFNETLSPLCQEVLKFRQTAGSTTYKKLATIIRQVATDNRLRNQFMYMGSARCGRWSGNGFQFHNMARPEPLFEDLDIIDWARAMIYAEDYEAITFWFGTALTTGTDPGSVLSTVKNCIRTSFGATRGTRFNVCDLNAIETRVGAWVSGCQGLLKVFTTFLCLDHPTVSQSKKGRCPLCNKKLEKMDPYLDFASKMTGIMYIDLARDIKSKDPAIKAAAKRHRQIAKPGVLGCIYRLSAGMITVDEDGNLIKTGLWAYAENMGVDMTEQQANDTVRVFREVYFEICDMWRDLEWAVADVLKGTRTVRELGPGGCIKIDKLNRKGRDPVLRIQLPSGRYLHYLDARLEDRKMPWKDREGNDVYKPTLVYSGTNIKTKQWGEVTSHGGKLFENIVQGIARDVLAYCLLKFEFEYDLPVCGHVHDEGITETPNDSFAPGLMEMEAIMSTEIEWAPDLPLGADGFESTTQRPYYHK